MKPYTHRLPSRTIESEVFDVTVGTYVMDIDDSYPHNFLGVIYYNDAGGATPVTPTSGTATVTARTKNQSQGFQAVTDGVLQANEVSQVDWGGNTLQVQAMLAAIVGATHARLVYTGNSA